ncbi:MAG: ABC-type transport auxiliary lipoprotein family protein [Candidatus Hydrogenedentes bacterium]|nr:ABC-type transport auxiliary lipoprotein family protein [Candidatus Hydrogenedentota bacterium]
MLRTGSGFLILATLLAGCLTPAAIEPTRYYTLSPTPVETGDVASSKSLGIRPLIAAKPYKLEIAYRAETNRLAYFPQSEWAELPATMVIRAIADSIACNRLFADVGEATAMARPDFVFTGELRRFEADYAGDTPEFVLSISASIRATGSGEGLWQDLIEVRVPLSGTAAEEITDDTLTDIARAASEAVSQLALEVCTRIRTAPGE